MTFQIIAAVVLLLCSGITAFTITSSSKCSLYSRRSLKLDAVTPNNNNEHNIIQRRTLLTNIVSASSTLLFLPNISNAESIPSVTSSEFDIILKDSAKSVLAVELSGPKSETALVKLVDGTTFTISDLVESSTDPRSPLKLVARCRLYKIPVKNTGLISVLNAEISDSGKKKKSYMNPRVQEAEKKQQAMRERMAEDERDRLQELYNMEGKEEGFLSDDK